ncbi:MAG: hypothetical protein KAJ39_07825, partial [Gammaproteobacteria bacterium]|nr:hypothetical protein [Gammaproteobacteria bacterium]
TSNGEYWKVGIIPYNSYENGTEIQSQTVLIGSVNSAPSLTSVFANITHPMKKYVNFTITTTGAGDANGDSYKLEIGSATGLSDIGTSAYFIDGNQSNISITIPYFDGLAHVLYARLNDSNLTSQERTVMIKSDITPPVVNTETRTPATGTQGATFGITINTTSINSTIKTVTMSVSRPDATTANWTMSNTVNDTWYYSYTSTSDIGTYTINSYTITDASDNADTIISTLSFTVTTATTSTGGTGGTGGTTVIVNGTIGDLTITPTRLDTYVLYGGFGEDRLLDYRFIANREVISCTVEPTEGFNDIAICDIVDGYILDIYLTINDSTGYSGTITVRDSEEFVATAPLIVRVTDIGAYVNTTHIPVGEKAASYLNLFFATENGILIGLRLWFIFAAATPFIGIIVFKPDVLDI